MGSDIISRHWLHSTESCLAYLLISNLMPDSGRSHSDQSQYAPCLRQFLKFVSTLRVLLKNLGKLLTLYTSSFKKRVAVSGLGYGQMRFPWFTIDLSIINLDCGSHLRTRQPSFGAQQGLASRADGFTLHGQLYEICNHMLTLAYTLSFLLCLRQGGCTALATTII